MRIRPRKDQFIVWNPFQRRAQSLGHMFDLDVRYYHFNWEEKGALFKAISYVFKASATLMDLWRSRPDFVFVQLAPTPLLYIASLYCLLAKSKVIADCHNTMIYDAHWIRWPLAIRLLSRSFVVMVHNKDVLKKAEELGLEAIVLRDPLPTMTLTEDPRTHRDEIAPDGRYVIVPCGMAVDEPVEDLFLAAGGVPDVTFCLTWYAEKLPPELRAKAPENVHFTGFLDEPVFNRLYANADAALVLTTREGTQPSGASEAIALGVPLVVSSIETTRHLYGDAVVFVENNHISIKNGILSALKQSEALAAKVASLRAELVQEAERQVRLVKRLMRAG